MQNARLDEAQARIKIDEKKKKKKDWWEKYQ